jgi:oligoribonuclease NrnB/cAMP/cGMP phosphodiesterase (DHH superfamily)
MRCVVIHHHDEDGRAAAAVVRLGVKGRTKEFLFIEAMYGKEIPFDQLREDDEIYVVDYSMQKPGDWDKLLAIPKKAGYPVTWIDHHVTAIEAANGTPAEKLPGIRKEGKKAGCMLAWDFFFPDAPAPAIIGLISDRDTWTWEHGDETAFLHAGLQMEDTSPESPMWRHMLVPSDCGTPAALRTLVEFGKCVVQYKQRFYSRLRKKLAYEVEFEGHKALAINVCGLGSEAFGFPGGYRGEMPDEWDILITFYFGGEHFTVSLYSKKVDVSAIAKKYGGGGHPGASGFQTDYLPFQKKAENG